MNIKLQDYFKSYTLELKVDYYNQWNKIPNDWKNYLQFLFLLRFDYERLNDFIVNDNTIAKGYFDVYGSSFCKEYLLPSIMLHTINLTELYEYDTIFMAGEFNIEDEHDERVAVHFEFENILDLSLLPSLNRIYLGENLKEINLLNIQKQIKIEEIILNMKWSYLLEDILLLNLPSLQKIRIVNYYIDENYFNQSYSDDDEIELIELNSWKEKYPKINFSSELIYCSPESGRKRNISHLEWFELLPAQ